MTVEVRHMGELAAGIWLKRAYSKQEFTLA